MRNQMINPPDLDQEEIEDPQVDLQEYLYTRNSSRSEDNYENLQLIVRARYLEVSKMTIYKRGE
jgi:hypothetical protein